MVVVTVPLLFITNYSVRLEFWFYNTGEVIDPIQTWLSLKCVLD